MRIVARLASLAVTSFVLSAVMQPHLAQAQEVFRDPFTLTLRAEKGMVYEERFEKAPYFAASTAFLFAGDAFGLKVTLADNEISAVSYEKDTTKADVVFKFTQEKPEDPKPMMMLVVQNKLSRPLLLDAFMTVPGRKGIYKTSTVPVRPGLSSYESWPHPIVQLALTNFRFAPK